MPGVRRSACVVVAACVASVTWATPAVAGYGGSVYSYSPGGARFEYYVHRLRVGETSITGLVRDTAADGYCAWVKVHISVPGVLDPVTKRQACGGYGATAPVALSYRYQCSTSTTIPGGSGCGTAPTLYYIVISVCRRYRSYGPLSSCHTVTVKRST